MAAHKLNNDLRVFNRQVNIVLARLFLSRVYLCRLPCVISPPFTMRSVVIVTSCVTVSDPSTVVALPAFPMLTGPSPRVVKAVVVA